MKRIRFVVAALSMHASVALGAPAVPGGDGSTNQWPAHRLCTLDLSRVVSSRTDSSVDMRIDMVLRDGTRPGEAPSISAHAINSKGTGATGRVAASVASHAVDVPTTCTVAAGPTAAPAWTCALRVEAGRVVATVRIPALPASRTRAAAVSAPAGPPRSLAALVPVGTVPAAHGRGTPCARDGAGLPPLELRLGD
jgi:hypothetical protein